MTLRLLEEIVGQKMSDKMNGGGFVLASSKRERERGKITGSSQRTGREQDLFAIHIILALLSQVSLVGTQQEGWKVASSLTVFQKHFR